MIEKQILIEKDSKIKNLAVLLSIKHSDFSALNIKLVVADNSEYNVGMLKSFGLNMEIN